MSIWMRRTIIALVLLALAGVVATLAGKHLGERKMARKISVDVSPLVLSGDADLAQGRYLFSTRGCVECHGANGGGKEVINAGTMLVVSPNITSGHNSVTAGYSMDDWVRTLRHGVKPNGTPVMIMPSEDYNRLTDDDVAAIVGYVRQLAPVDGRSALVELPVAVRVMYGYGAVRDAAEVIDHTLAPALPVPVSVTVAHGAYVAQSCIGCHGAQLSGGRIPGAPPLWPASANLTPGKGSAMTRYPNADALMKMLRSGQRPDGSAISPVMPFGSLREMSDVDVHALHAYLQTLPPREAGGR